MTPLPTGTLACMECGDGADPQPCACGNHLCPDHRAEHDALGCTTIFTPEQRAQMDATVRAGPFGRVEDTNVYARFSTPAPPSERVDVYEDSRCRVTLKRRHDESCPTEWNEERFCESMPGCRYQTIIEVSVGPDARGETQWREPTKKVDWATAAFALGQHVAGVNEFGRPKS